MTRAAASLRRPLQASASPPTSRTGRARRTRGGRRPRVDPLATYEALSTLRAADDLTSPSLASAWAAVMRALLGLARNVRMGSAADREDASQEAFLKVRGAVRDLEADAPLAAVAWLRRVYERVLLDLLRSRERRREVFDARTRDDVRPSRLEQVPALPPDDPRIHDPARLAPFEEALFEAVEDYVTRTVKVRHREHALHKAQLAYRKVVKRETAEALLADAGDVSRETLYQWTRRGRVHVLLPAVLAWLETLPPDSDAHAFASGLAALLREADRADAGQPRPGRRKKNDDAPVSPEDHWKSAQCETDEDDEDHDE